MGFWEVFCLASGAMISSGLFVLPGIAFLEAGPSIILSYAVAGLLMIPAMLCSAELATAMPRAGGTYFFVERSMGALPGLLAGLANWLSLALKSAFALIGIGAFAELMLGRPVDEWTIKGIAIACCVVFAVLNIVSVKGTGAFQVVLVVFLLAILVGFVAMGLPAVRDEHYDRFFFNGLQGMFSTAGLVFISYGGLTTIASVGEEVRNPGRNLAGGMFLAALVVSFLYVAAVFVTVGILGPEGLLRGAGEAARPTLTPLSDAAGGTALRTGGTVVMAIGAILAFVTTANGGILTASRNPMAMSRDRLLPGVFSRLAPRFGTPWVSILVTSGFMILLIALLSIRDLVKTASTMVLVLFLMTALAVVIMRTSGIQNYRPRFRMPMYPWIPLLGMAFYAMLIIEMGLVPLAITAGFAVLGTLWYAVWYPRVRARGTDERESALVYMVRRVLSREMYRTGLEEELREIALERDEVTHDRFDRLVQQCPILDLPGAATHEQLFRQAAEALAPRLHIDVDHLYGLLLEREQRSSTVVRPGLAIPHVIVEGEGRFELLVVRCREGVTFSGQAEPVQTAMILAGSADERNYHLKALMAIAHVVQEREFLDRWLAAPAGDHLRDIFLLSERKRDAK